jgi:hypothetical protein
MAEPLGNIISSSCGKTEFSQSLCHFDPACRQAGIGRILLALQRVKISRFTRNDRYLSNYKLSKQELVEAFPIRRLSWYGNNVHIEFKMFR